MSTDTKIMTLPSMPPDPETEIQDLTRDECRVIVDYEDYAALRSVALAYLEALHVAVDALQKISDVGNDPDNSPCYETKVADKALASLGKLPERAP